MPAIDVGFHYNHHDHDDDDDDDEEDDDDDDNDDDDDETTGGGCGVLCSTPTIKTVFLAAGIGDCHLL